MSGRARPLPPGRRGRRRDHEGARHSASGSLTPRWPLQEPADIDGATSAALYYGWYLQFHFWLFYTRRLVALRSLVVDGDIWHPLLLCQLEHF